MEPILRGLIVYIFLFLVFRIAGNRTLSQATTFDLVLLLIISETTQQAMVDNDHSVTNCFLLVMTLIGTTILLLILKQKFPRLRLWLESAPLVVVDHGKLLHDCMNLMHVDKDDILEAARQTQGLERLDQIKFAVVERNGDISIIPR